MYYIYELWNPISNEPIYVGYGKQNRKTSSMRHEDHLKEALKYRENKIKKSNVNMYKINVLIQMIDNGVTLEYKFPFSNLSYEEACVKETELIAHYGRRCLGTGPLTNIDPGGRGGRELTEETRLKMSLASKGRPSHLKGKILGSYSEERKKSIKNGVSLYLSSEEGKLKRKNVGEKLKGRTAWNKGKNKESDPSVAKYANSKIGISRIDMIGNIPWNAGKNKFNNEKLKEVSEKLKGRTAWNKGMITDNKGKTYEEIYGVETAKKMKALRSNTAWINNGTLNKKINLSDLASYLETGWIRGRIMPKRG